MKWLKKQTNTSIAENLNQAEITESEGIQTIVNHVARQVAAEAVMMMQRDTILDPNWPLHPAKESHRDRTQWASPRNIFI